MTPFKYSNVVRGSYGKSSISTWTISAIVSRTDRWRSPLGEYLTAIVLMSSPAMRSSPSEASACLANMIWPSQKRGMSPGCMRFTMKVWDVPDESAWTISPKSPKTGMLAGGTTVSPIFLPSTGDATTQTRGSPTPPPPSGAATGPAGATPAGRPLRTLSCPASSRPRCSHRARSAADIGAKAYTAARGTPRGKPPPGGAG